MLDLGFVRDNLELVKQKMRERGLPVTLEDFESLDRERRGFLLRVENLKALRNKRAEEIAVLKRQNRDATAQIAETRQLRAEIEKLEPEEKNYEERIREVLRNIPNIPHPSVPVGKGSAENQEIRR